MDDPITTATAAVVAAIDVESAAATADLEANGAWQHWRDIVKAAAVSPLGLEAFEAVLGGLGIATAAQGFEHSCQLQAAAADADRAMADAGYLRQMAERDLKILRYQADRDRDQAERDQSRADREARSAADWLSRPNAINRFLDEVESRALESAVVAAEAVRR